MLLRIGKIVAVILAALVIFFFAIGGPFRRSPRIALSDAEEKLQQKWREQFKCESIELRHDYRAIKAGTINGTFTVSWCDEECRQDSILIVKRAKSMARELKSILSHRESYKDIFFSSSITKDLDEITSEEICSLYITLDAKSINLQKYSHYEKAVHK